MLKRYSYILLSLLLAAVLVGNFWLLLTLGEKSRIQTETFQQINRLKLIDRDFDSFLNKKMSYFNYDRIVKKTQEFHTTLEKLQNTSKQHADSDIGQMIFDVEKAFQNKLDVLNKYKAYNSQINNSTRYLMELKKELNAEFHTNANLINLIDQTYYELILISLELNLDLLELESKIAELAQFAQMNEKESLSAFVKHISIVGEYVKKTNTVLQGDDALYLVSALDKLTRVYDDYFQKNQKTQLYLVVSIFIISILFFLSFVFIFRKDQTIRKELETFRKAVEDSDNSIVMTDPEQKITYVNEAFTRISGYSREEAIGEHPRILKSGVQDGEFYRHLNKQIDLGKTWHGEFVNKKKSGEIYYEKSSISPMHNEAGELIGFLAIKLDISQEKRYQKKLRRLNEDLEKRIQSEVEKNREKDHVLIQQSRLAYMGEMLHNIAHQWRQPLTVISLAVADIEDRYMMGELEEEQFHQKVERINESVQYLSTTIEDFKGFYTQDTHQNFFSVLQSIQKSIDVISPVLQSHFIEILLDYEGENFEVNGFRSNYEQAIMNILNNAKDVLINAQREKNQFSGVIRVRIRAEKDQVRVAIEDNAGGVPDDIIERIFDPYFTTKFAAQGTGIGLYMTKMLIEATMGGRVEVKNSTQGAVFIVTLPRNASSS